MRLKLFIDNPPEALNRYLDKNASKIARQNNLHMQIIHNWTKVGNAAPIPRLMDLLRFKSQQFDVRLQWGKTQIIINPNRLQVGHKMIPCPSWVRLLVNSLVFLIGWEMKGK